MKFFVPLFAAALCLLSGVACDTKRSYTSDAQEQRRLGDKLLAGVRIDGAVSGARPGEAGDHGGVIWRICGPIAVHTGQPFELDFTFSDDAPADASLVVQPVRSSLALRLPMAPVLASRKITVTLGEVPDGLDGPLRLYFGVTDASGAVGALNAWTARHPNSEAVPVRACTYGPQRGGVAQVALSEGAGTLGVLAVGGPDGAVSLYDTRSGRRTFEFESGGSRVTALAVVPEIGTLGVGHQDGSAALYDLTTGGSTISGQLHDEAVTSMGIAEPEGRALPFTGGWDGRIHLVTQIAPFESQPIEVGERVNALAASADGGRIAAAVGRLVHEGRLVVWDTEQRSVEFEVALSDTATAVTFAQEWVVVGYGRGHIEAYDRTGRMVQTFEGGPADLISAVVYRETEGEGRLLSTTLDGTLALWNAETGALILTGSDDSAPVAIGLSRDGRFLAIGLFAGLTDVIDVGATGL